jgi:hypothetical protein
MLAPLYCYEPDYSNFHEVRFISYTTEEFYNKIGKFTLTVAPTQYNIDVIKPNGILYRTDSKQAMWIQRVSPDTSSNKITVNGYTVNAKLNKRVFAQSATIAVAQNDIYTAITNNLRGLSDVIISSSTTLTEPYAAILQGGQILDEIIPILDACDLGHRMIFDTVAKKHTFEIYKGRDLTSGSQAMIFSDERGTARGLKIENDQSVFKNVCYVNGKKTDDTQVTRTVGTSTADERYELWLDSTISQETGETDAVFYQRMDDAGLSELAQRVKRTSFSVTVNESEYGVAFKLGDKVSCVSKRFDVKFNARVTGVKFTQDPAIRTVGITLGEPELDVLGEIKLGNY